ncbi:hypothetical protein GBAR_LOCUS15257, partial [Geodia barretti]
MRTSTPTGHLASKQSFYLRPLLTLVARLRALQASSMLLLSMTMGSMSALFCQKEGPCMK